MSEPISITRALKKIKLNEDKLQSAMKEPLIQIKRGTSGKDVLNVSSKTVDEVSSMVQGNFDKIKSLINDIDALRSAIALSNALTVVTIAGSEMKVTTAITRKVAAKVRQQFIATMITQLRTSQAIIDGGNATLEAKIDQAMTGIYAKEKNVLPNAEQRKGVAEPMEAASKLSLIDPVGLAEHAKKEMEDLANFLAEVDFILSESNAVTLITV